MCTSRLRGLSVVLTGHGLLPREEVLLLDAYGFELKGYTKRKVTAVNGVSPATPYTLTANMSGQVFTTYGAGVAVTFNLPTIVDDDEDYKGVFFTFVKLASSALHVQVAAGERVADSNASGTVCNATSETYATVTVVSVANSQWMIEGAHGTWTTT